MTKQLRDALQDARFPAGRAARVTRVCSSAIWASGEFGRLAETDDAGHVLGAGATAALLMPAAHQRLEARRRA